jgi:inhibitor of KinA
LIAGGQALIASVAMPTGWYDLGCTPVLLFDPERTPPSTVDSGDEITFERVDGATFAALKQAASEGQPVLRQKR